MGLTAKACDLEVGCKNANTSWPGCKNAQVAQDKGCHRKSVKSPDRFVGIFVPSIMALNF